MSADPVFDAAVGIVLLHEGGLADDEDDPGGVTHWGVSLRYARQLGAALADVDHDGDVDADDIRAMPRDRAEEIYRIDWWGRYRYGALPAWLGWKVFDLAVNAGPRPIHRALQASLVACGAPLAVDGLLGPRTASAAQAASPARLAGLFRDRCWGHYRGLIAANPQLAKFAGGWEARVYC